MREETKTGRLGFQYAVTRTGSIRSKLFARRIIVSAASVALSVALVACGGGSSSGPTSGAISTPQSMAKVAAAASAASSATVSLATSLKMNASSIAPDTQTDHFIVKYKTGTAERNATSAVQSRLDALASTFPSRAHHLRRIGVGSDVITTERKLNAKEAKAFMRTIASDPDVEYVEPDVPISTSFAPNDPFYSLQWGLFSNQDPGQSNVGIRATNAWNIATGAGITIGLVDNGVTSHSDLNANIIPAGYDFTYLAGPYDGSDPGVTVETCSPTFHGTHVAGIMAAVTNNGVGVAGVAPSAKIVSARAMGACGRGSLSSAANALIWSAGGTVPDAPINTHPASVINASFGGAGQCPKTMQDAIDYANSRGVVVIVAANNYGDDASNYMPSSCRGVITVGNTQRDGSRNPNSDYGPTVDVAAPGTDIYSTFNAGTSTAGAESYAYMTGTSMSAPMVSGVVALVQSVAPKQLSPAEMRTLITQHAQPFPNQPDQPLGSGILDATATVAAARAGEIPAAADFKCSQGAAGMLVTCSDLSTARGMAQIKSWAWNMGFGDPANMVRTQSVNPYYNYEYPGT